MPLPHLHQSPTSDKTSPFPSATVSACHSDISWSHGALSLGECLGGGMGDLESLVRALLLEDARPAQPGAYLAATITRPFSTVEGHEIFLRAEVVSPASGEHHIRFVDDTRYAHLERKGRGHEDLLERLIEALPVAIFTKDPNDDFRVKRINRCYEETFGVRRDEIVGCVDADFCPPELVPGYREADEAVFQSRDSLEVEEVIETSRGLRAAKTIKIPFFDEHGSPELLLGILQDVEDLHSLVREAEEASALKSRFLANMSHEIRTPIYGILGMLDAASTDWAEEDRATALVSAESCARTLLAVINDILDLSKVEEGKLSIGHEPMNLCTVILGAMSSLGGYGLERGVTVRLQGDVTPETTAACQTMLMGDAGRLGQVLVNLLSNAMKFSPEGGEVQLSVKRRTLQTFGDHRDHVRFEISDEGPGIPEEDQETIFSAFGQSTHAGAGSYESTGLGLAIVKQIVEILGGSVGVISEVGHGATFWVELKLDHARVNGTDELAPQATDADTDGSGTLLPKAQVLVAEDNPVNQRIIRRILEKAGHGVTIVGDGVAAVDAAMSGASHFDFVLMDVQMPKLDGLGATRAIREAESLKQQVAVDYSGLPIIVLTANAMKGDQELSMEAGADGYLTKPLEKEALFETMALLDRRPSTERSEPGVQ